MTCRRLRNAVVAVAAACLAGPACADHTGSPTTPGPFVGEPAGIWDGTSTYFNAPFTVDLRLTGTSLAGRYTDQHDLGYVSGTYTGGTAIVIDVTFGDGGIRLEGEFEGPDRINGTMRVSTISRLFPFTMIRRR